MMDGKITIDTGSKTFDVVEEDGLFLIKSLSGVPEVLWKDKEFTSRDSVEGFCTAQLSKSSGMKIKAMPKVGERFSDNDLHNYAERENYGVKCIGNNEN
jgi:hypothetical protein